MMDTKKHSILIVDDQKTEIMALNAILKPDYIVHAAGSGADAILAAEKIIPDIILLDIYMMDMDGYEVFDKLKKIEATKNIPVIFITGLANEESEKNSLAMGAVDYITKPFTAAIVKLRIKNQINILEQLRTIEMQMNNIKSLEYENVKNMLDSTPYSCHLWNKDFEILDCNEASLKLFKVDNKREFISRFHEFSPEYQPDGKLSSEKAKAGLDFAIREGKGVFDWMHHTSDGQPIPCEVTLVRIKLQSNDFVVVYLKDLREQHAMMEEIKQQDKLLYTVSCIAGILLHSSIEDFTEDMYICMGMMAEAVDADRVYIWKNHTVNGDLHCTQIYEWSEGAEPQQGNEITVDISYKKSIPDWEDVLSNGMCVNGMVKDMSPASQEQLAPQGIVSIFVAPVFLNDYFWGFIGFDDCHKEKVFSENEELILRSAGLLIANSMLRNEMTANLQSSSVQLEKALKEAQAANEAKSIFLSNMSHEIRTPMNAITGMGELLLHEQLNERQLGYVDDIVVSANALLGIINDILDFSKIESGKLELNPVDYDFMAFIDHIKSMFDYVAEKKGLEFILECGENLPLFFFGDDLRLRQTLTNILGNAIKFTEKGHVCLKVTESENSLIFVIRDTGIGIRKEDLPKLFNAFEQVDKSKNRNVVGTGLGLAISKSFVEMMGGSIKLESEYGQGTVFTITIPIVLGSKERIINRSAYIESHAFHAPEADILVVDDNEFNLRVAYGLLNLMEIEADTADSGFKAIDLVKEKDYDIVFMDHMMPEMDGVDTVREIRKLGGKFENLIIIALTANVVKNAQDMFLSSGFNDFLAKPIEVGELYDIVRKYLPEGKIRTVDMTEDVKARASKGDELYRKAIVTFVKENHFTFDNISASLLSGDMKTAHRIAHTLKSSAGFLEKKELQDAAFSLEQSLQCEPPVYTPRQLEVLELELRKALHEYEPMVAAMESVKPDAVEVDGRELSSLLSELEPLLVQGDFGAVDYVEKLQGIAGMKELAERIDDYDFENALNILKQFTA